MFIQRGKINVLINDVNVVVIYKSFNNSYIKISSGSKGGRGGYGQ